MPAKGFFSSYLGGIKHCLGTFGLAVTVCTALFVLNVTVGFGNRCMNKTTQFVSHTLQLLLLYHFYSSSSSTLSLLSFTSHSPDHPSKARSAVFLCLYPSFGLFYLCVSPCICVAYVATWDHVQLFFPAGPSHLSYHFIIFSLSFFCVYTCFFLLSLQVIYSLLFDSVWPLHHHDRFL